MVKLRLRRMGRKKRPVYDIVATDSRNARDGRFIEKVGQYNPMVPANQVALKRDRVMHWLAVGAQPTDSVRSILSREGLLLEVQMRYKGKSDEEIAQSVENHVAQKQNREVSDLAAIAEAHQRRLREEEAVAKAEADAIAAAEAAVKAEAAAAKAEAEATAKAEADAAAAAATAEAAPEPVAEAPAAEAPAADEAPAAAEAAEAPAADEAPAAEAPAAEAPAAEAPAAEATDGSQEPA